MHKNLLQLFIMPDLNSSFTLDNEQVIVDKNKDIIQSLDRLFSTRVGSVPFNRNYGSHLYSLLFENTNSINQIDVGLLLYRDVTAQEPRVYINPYGVSLIKLNENSYKIILNVYINDTSESFTYSLQVNKDTSL